MSCYNPDPACNCRACDTTSSDFKPLKEQKIKAKRKLSKSQIDEKLQKAIVLHRKQLEKLAENCQHYFETFRSYDGTDYTCRKCGYTK